MLLRSQVGNSGGEADFGKPANACRTLSRQAAAGGDQGASSNFRSSPRGSSNHQVDS